MKTPLFWTLLEEMGLRTACRQEFQNRLGAEYDTVEGFIVPVEARDGEELHVEGYPCAKCGRDHTVEPVAKGKYLAYPDEDPELTPCKDITGLVVDDVWPRRVDIKAVGRAVAAALRVTPEFDGRKGGPWRIGTTVAGRYPVFLSFRSGEPAYFRDADAVRADTRGHFLFLTATPRSRVADRFGRDSGACFALVDVILFGAPGKIGAVATAESLIANGLPVPVVGGPVACAPLRGKLFEIEEDFSGIWKLRPRKVRYAITTLSCQDALRVLVERGAISRKTALPKQEWCKAVWRKCHPDRPVLGDHKPIQFFRVRLKGKTVQVPWYKDVIGTDGHGRYWLQL